MVVIKPPSPMFHDTWLKSDGAGAPTDAEFISATSSAFVPMDGLKCYNTVDNKLYIRALGVYKGSAAFT